MAMPCPSSKPSSVPCLMFLAIERELHQVGAAHAAHQHARRIERRRRQRLALDDAARRDGCRRPWRRGRPPRPNRSAGDSSGWISRWPLRPKNLVKQFLAEAVHHRHDDDQRRDAEHDAEKREPGDDRNESFFAPRPQVAQRQHPLEWSERHGAGRSRPFESGPREYPDFTRFWRFQAAKLSRQQSPQHTASCAQSAPRASAGRHAVPAARRRAA